MFEFTISITNQAILDEYVELLRRFPETVRVVVDEVVLEYGAIAEQSLARVPGPVRYPFLWTSLRQKRAYFATNGFGAGIPYRRTFAIAQGWKVTAEPGQGDSPASIQIANAVPGVQYVEGYRQQPGHVMTGWLNASNELVTTGNLMVEEVRTKIRAVVGSRRGRLRYVGKRG